MKSIAKCSAALLSLLALTGVSASANQKSKNSNVHQNSSNKINQLETPASQNSQQSNSDNDNNDNSNGDNNGVVVSQINNHASHKSSIKYESSGSNKSNASQKVRENHTQKESESLDNDYSKHNDVLVHKKHHHNYKLQNNIKMSSHKNKDIRLQAVHVHHHHHHHKLMAHYKGKLVPKWFIDGLSKKQLSARGWIVRHESGGHWDILSYGHRCIGRYQLAPGYLGYKHHHVNLNHKHQTLVADEYVSHRYGSWINAKGFWEYHHWY